MRAGHALLGAAALAAGASAQPPQQPQYLIAAWSRTTAAEEDAGDAIARGAAVYNNWCSACHGRDLPNAPGTASLQFKYRGELPAVLEDRRDLTPELVAFYVRNGVATMPFFRKTEVSDADLEALAAYLTQR